jgi:peroxiredoxin
MRDIIDDGGCAHLTGITVPSFPLRATSGRTVDLATVPGRTVLYIYPRTSRPGEAPPTGWDEIPGARGCTPQSCAFRDHHAALLAAGTEVYGLSTQTTAYQQEAVERLHLPFELLSDAELAFASALRLPTFAVDGMTLIRRLTLVIQDGRIEHVFYPVPEPDRNAEDVLAWLRSHPT